MTRKQNEQKLESVIRDFLNSPALKDKYLNTEIEACWRDLFGPVVVGYTEKMDYKKGVLTVQIRSSSLREELWRNKDRLQEVLNESLGGEVIKELMIR